MKKIICCIILLVLSGSFAHAGWDEVLNEIKEAKTSSDMFKIHQSSSFFNEAESSKADKEKASKLLNFFKDRMTEIATEEIIHANNHEELYKTIWNSSTYLHQSIEPVLENQINKIIPKDIEETKDPIELFEILQMGLKSETLRPKLIPLIQARAEKILPEALKGITLHKWGTINNYYTNDYYSRGLSTPLSTPRIREILSDAVVDILMENIKTAKTGRELWDMRLRVQSLGSQFKLTTLFSEKVKELAQIDLEKATTEQDFYNLNTYYKNIHPDFPALNKLIVEKWAHVMPDQGELPMRILVKQISGGTVAIKIGFKKLVSDLYKGAYERRYSQQENASFDNYITAVQLMYAGKILDPSKSLEEYGLSDGSDVSEVLKSWTMSPGFDIKTLSSQSSISLEPMQHPYHLNPGCGHSFEFNEIRQWMQTSLDSSSHPLCPLCKGKILPTHLFKVLPNNQ